MPKRKSRSTRSRAPARAKRPEPKAPEQPVRKYKPQGGRPEFVPTEQQRQLVHTMAGYRIAQDEMALLVINPATKKPISETTLKKVFEQELQAGYANLKVRIMAATVRNALGETKTEGDRTVVIKEGNVTAQIWLGKTLYGMQEPGKGGDKEAPPPPQPAEGGTDLLDGARRIAFTLRLGVMQGKKAA